MDLALVDRTSKHLSLCFGTEVINRSFFLWVLLLHLGIFIRASSLSLACDVSPDLERLREEADFLWTVLTGDLFLCPRECPLLSCGTWKMSP